MEPTTYYLLALAAGCLAFIISIAAINCMRRRIRTPFRDREVDLLLKLHQASTTSPMEGALRVVWSLQGAMPSEEQRPQCELVCIFFELLGTLVRYRYTETELMDGFFGSLVTDTYASLRAYIEYMRSKPRNENFAQNFERLQNRIAAADAVHHSPDLS